MGKRGGKQPGAGRPKGSVGKSTAMALQMREELVQRVKKEFGPIVDALIEDAKGLYEEKVTKDGTIKIFKNKPNYKASEYLFNQSIGKPKETVEMSGKNGGPMLIKLDE